MKSSRKPSRISVFEIVIFAVLAVFSITLITLFLWGLISSFRKHYGVIEEPFKLFDGLTLDNYKSLFNDFYFKSGKMKYSIYDLFGDSFLYSIGGALAQTFATAVMAYCTAKYPGKVSTFINYLPQPPHLQVDLPPLHFTLHVVQEPQPSNPSESPEGNLLIDFETVAVKQLIKT